MALKREVLVFRMVLFMALLGLSVSTYISHEVFKTEGSSPGRSLAEMNCHINFRHQNYTILTSKCKAPRYYGRLCCPAFKEFACSFADDLNDVDNNDCAYIMFSFINLHGKYPPGLFFDKCVEGKFGLRCPDVHV
ncbi:GPI-anchored protein LORELEI-like protein [Carex littledalei]|uniref:GPI-anchored protein LORELEI-like protein n=1 Tax=Carex littledalei TaxID=544730 RepID=A0A833R1W1_9POAL|nr:GPI-anchored protein LORELEI-like protein [Carex littledalei]